MRLVFCIVILAAAAGVSPVRRTQAADDGPDSLAREMLAAHNAVRQRMGIRPLAWSNRLASYAQEWADTLAASGEFKHRSDPVYGENLFDITWGSVSPSEVVRDWAAQSEDYDYKANRCRGICGHYTQIVWKTTKRVGCAMAKRGNREVWVCNYDPPGNLIGLRPY
jgi:uncharacterized protein YkwD